ncbi:MAG TPA: AAA family ATPase [Bacteroidales bacterium]|nr:AAA family ATPase [Bacteroidales bacterium]
MERTALRQKLEIAFGFEPTSGQSKALEHLAAFLLSDKPNPLYLLRGYAGTGKTSMVSAIVKVLPALGMHPVLLAPTGRAAKVLSAYTGLNASTIHRKIYFQTRNADGSMHMVRATNKHRKALFVVDEASMIPDTTTESLTGNSLLDDLMEYVAEGQQCRLILIGDQAQLPPVGLALSPALNLQYLKSRYQLTAAGWELTEVMRQSLESGILSNATAIRKKLENNDFTLPLLQIGGQNDVCVLAGSDMEEVMTEHFGRHDFSQAVVVCRSNKTANRFNQAIRQRIIGLEGELSAGELLMVVKNNYFWLSEAEQAGFVANGDIIELMRVIRYEQLYDHHFAEAEVRLVDYPELPPFQVKLLLDTLTAPGPSLSDDAFRAFALNIEEDYADEPSRRKRMAKLATNPYYNALMVKYAYALTCHKTQGGQWPVVFIEQGRRKDQDIDADYLRWLYTALTRATQKVYLLGFDAESIEMTNAL